TISAGGGSTVWNTASLADGAWDLQAVGYDNAGNSTATSPITVSIDNTAPTLDVQCNGGPCETTYYTTSPVTVTATSADANGTAQVIYSNGTTNPFLDPGRSTYRGAITVGATT